MPRIFQAPGRVNLIGEHTDYNDGFVLPAAIQLQTRVAVGAEAERVVIVHSTAYPDEAILELDDPNPKPRKHWSDYVRGVALSLGHAGVALKGARLLIKSDIPPGAGLSSSAALEISCGLALLANAGRKLDTAQIAQVCHRAENEFIGLRSGIMDQVASLEGRRNHALLLDCRSLAVRHILVPSGVAMMVCNTMVRHELGSSEYNTRRRECEEGVAILARFIPGVRALRDVAAGELEKYKAELEPVIYRRCRHVIGENQRVLDGADALERGELLAFGALMVQSHESLRLDYEVSCSELDLMCELSLRVEGVYGARMMGGGFGGCALALVKQSVVPAFRTKVADEYQRRTGIASEIYECFAADGAGSVGS
ncbi:MAG: galactokinase [Candidatus Eremiobacteraeota bacterium]|nr:galactokinase [Candidatus Eremiobacteraeota bacterium]